MPSVCSDTGFLSRKTEPAICKVCEKLWVPPRLGSLPRQERKKLPEPGRLWRAWLAAWPRGSCRWGLFPARHFQVPLEALAKEMEQDDSVYELCVIQGVKGKTRSVSKRWTLKFLNLPHSL